MLGFKRLIKVSANFIFGIPMLMSITTHVSYYVIKIYFLLCNKVLFSLGYNYYLYPKFPDDTIL